MLEKLLNIFFPPICVMCGKVYKNWICPKCYLKIKPELKYKEIKLENTNIYFLGFYEKRIKKLILNFKFRDEAYIGKMFSYLLLKNPNWKNKFKKYDYIISVPMHKQNKKLRGYNQSEIIADEICKKINIKSGSDILLKTRQNKKQSTLSMLQRKENVKNVFKVKDEVIIKNKNILLIDDIYTTGNTIKSCIKELKNAKINKVDVLVLGKTKLKSKFF